VTPWRIQGAFGTLAAGGGGWWRPGPRSGDECVELVAQQAFVGVDEGEELLINVVDATGLVEAAGGDVADRAGDDYRRRPDRGFLGDHDRDHECT
jgi:hypothetical protein